MKHDAAPTASPARAPATSMIHPISGPPIGVEPMNATDHSDITRPRIRGSEFRLLKNALYLMLEWDEAADRDWVELMRRLAALPAFDGIPPFPSAQGLFLADREQRSDKKVFEDALGETPAFRFGAFSCSLLTLDISDPPDPWWRQVYWELSGEIRARKSARRRPDAAPRQSPSDPPE